MELIAEECWNCRNSLFCIEFAFDFNGRKHYAPTHLPFSDKEKDCKDNAKLAINNEKRYFFCWKLDF